MTLSDPLQYLPGVGPTLAKKLSKLDLISITDLINHYPFRYDDFSKVSLALDVKVGERVTLRGEIWSISNIYTRTRKVLTRAIFNDGTSSIELVWFNQPWLEKSISVGDKLQISGKLDKRGSKLTVSSPVWEKVSLDTSPDKTLHTGRLVPVYPETYGLSSKWFRAKISDLLPKFEDQIKDPLPSKIKAKMVSLNEALNKIHFPKNWQEVEKARERLSFDELFFISLATQKKRAEWKSQTKTRSLSVNNKLLSEFIESLPFELTEAQRRVIKELTSDLEKDTPMNRLLQGEVGSGKTVVAAAAIFLTAKNSLSSLLMAPTEILAFQHFETTKKLLEPFGIKVGIYTGSRKEAKDSQVIIGTHALLTDRLSSENVGLVIVDEQQRFGVQQRSLLRTKHKLPHFLSMTATPIPRTVALTLYGDLDLSVIDQMPKGRRQVKTYVVPTKKRDDAYGFLKKKVKEGDQVYIITPLIEESETSVTAKAAKVEYERLRQEIFPELRLGLLHGKLKSKEKEEVINNFKDGNIDILVSTSVVEVGVDIPNATVMVIEGADRFGLATLHQLRGRVGRGAKESFCLLFSEIETAQILHRLKNLERIYNGLELAELDFKIRGSGDIFGSRQSGKWELKIARLTDLNLVEKTSNAAKDLLKDDVELKNYPLIKERVDALTQVEAMPD